MLKHEAAAATAECPGHLFDRDVAGGPLGSCHEAQHLPLAGALQIPVELLVERHAPVARSLGCGVVRFLRGELHFKRSLRVLGHLVSSLAVGRNAGRRPWTLGLLFDHIDVREHDPYRSRRTLERRARQRVVCGRIDLRLARCQGAHEVEACQSKGCAVGADPFDAPLEIVHSKVAPIEHGDACEPVVAIDGAVVGRSHAARLQKRAGVPDDLSYLLRLLLLGRLVRGHVDLGIGGRCAARGPCTRMVVAAGDPERDQPYPKSPRRARHKHSPPSVAAGLQVGAANEPVTWSESRTRSNVPVAPQAFAWVTWTEPPVADSPVAMHALSHAAYWAVTVLGAMNTPVPSAPALRVAEDPAGGPLRSRVAITRAARA